MSDQTTFVVITQWLCCHGGKNSFLYGTPFECEFKGWVAIQKQPIIVSGCRSELEAPATVSNWLQTEGGNCSFTEKRLYAQYITKVIPLCEWNPRSHYDGDWDVGKYPDIVHLNAESFPMPLSE